MHDYIQDSKPTVESSRETKNYLRLGRYVAYGNIKDETRQTKKQLNYFEEQIKSKFSNQWKIS